MSIFGRLQGLSAPWKVTDYRKHLAVPVLTLTLVDIANIVMFPPRKGLLRCADCGYNLYWI